MEDDMARSCLSNSLFSLLSFPLGKERHEAPPYHVKIPPPMTTRDSGPADSQKGKVRRNRN